EFYHYFKSIEKKKLFCAFIDYRKAFDMVWRQALWYKLLKMGIKGKFLAVVKSMYYKHFLCHCNGDKIKAHNIQNTPSK
uniref:Uncharacterized protein n=1 Tax=Acanthochromis polyacanthus TaxID=80966 RepID=A0A3Q1GCK8_9TELE